MRLYRYGLVGVGLLFAIPVLSGIAIGASRIILRHARWRAHLRAFNFDGVIDGGANIGEFAQAVRVALPKAHLICVEPHAGCAADLRKQRFEVVEAALWNQKGKLKLFQPGATTSCTVMEVSGTEKYVEVDAVRLDELPIRGNRLLVKLDLQGAEPVALEALGDLERRCEGFLLEVSLRPDGNYHKLDEYFRAKGFRQFASVNELFEGDVQVEADILWMRLRQPSNAQKSLDGN